MKVTYKKVINENKDNRVEFWINNFDYEDGNDYLATLFSKEFNMTVEEKKDYIYFSIIKIHNDDAYYNLLWHEDVGNIIYSEGQEKSTIDVLENKLKRAIDILNNQLES